MFEPRSYLQKLADIWKYPDYINAAAAQQDPLERMKLLVTWVVAGKGCCGSCAQQLMAVIFQIQCWLGAALQADTNTRPVHVAVERSGLDLFEMHAEQL